MIMNCGFIGNQGLKLRKRVEAFGSDTLIEYCSKNIFGKTLLLNGLHMELHNRGHFSGCWPFDNEKSQPVYEAVEEFRACLVAGSIGQILLDDKNLSLALCVTIVLNRLLIYGFEVYLLADEKKLFQMLEK